jgi:hypothetical protein
MLPWGVTGGGTVVITPGTDHVVWTKRIAEHTDTVTVFLKGDDSVKSVDLRVAGTLSDRAKKELEAHGWKAQERALPPARRK